MKKIEHKWAIVVGMFIFMGVILGTTFFSHILPENGVESEKEKVQEAEHRRTTIEGNFVDRNGNIIMEPTAPTPENNTVLDLSYSYLLGYNHAALGDSGLRKIYRKHLYNDDNTGKGGTVQLTIDDELQKKAHALLKNDGYAGSIIVLDAKTGEILTMASRREVDYDLTEFSQERFDVYKEIQDPLGRKVMFRNPATDDMAAPGSVFKIVTSCAAIENGMDGFTYEDETGVLMVDNAEIPNFGRIPQGYQTLQLALINSTNTYFASLALALGEKAMSDMVRKFLIGTTISLGYTNLPSSVEFNKGDFNLAQIGWGQGSLALSPLHMAAIAQSIANDGTMCAPFITKALYDVHGRQLVEDEGKTDLAYPIAPETARRVKEMMKTVAQAYVNKAGYPNLFAHTENVYCKTGTADLSNTTSINNAYFLCMTDDYVILTTVINTNIMGGNLVHITDHILNDLY